MRRRLAFAFAAATVLLSACIQPELARPGRRQRCDVLCGHVVDAATSKPVSRFTVTVFDTNPPAIFRSVRLPAGYPIPPGSVLLTFDVSDPDGAFDIPAVRAQAVVIGIRAADHLLFQTERIQLPAGSPLDVRLDRAWQVSGRVIDDEGRPVIGALIYYDNPTSDLTFVLQNVRSGVTPLARTAANGRYAITDVQNSGVPLSVVAIGPGIVPQRALIVIGGAATTHDFHVARGFAVDGIVVDQSGSPVRAFVEAPIGADALRAGTNEHGRFHFDALPRGKRRFSASREVVQSAYSPRTELGFGGAVEADPAADGELRIALPAAGVIRGRLTGLSRIDEHYSVSLRCGSWIKTQTAGPNGSFRATVPAGPCSVSGEYRDEEGLRETATEIVNVTDGSETTIDPAFLNPTALRLTLNGAPMNEKVTLTAEGAASPALVTFDALHLAGLRSGRYSASFNVLDRDYSVPIEIGAQAEYAYDLKLAPASIEAVDAQGRRLSERLQLVEAEYAPGQPHPAVDRLDASMPPGKYQVRVSAPGYEPQVVALRVPGDAVRVVLDPKPPQFVHAATAVPLADDEAAVIAVVIAAEWKEAREFWRSTHDDKRRRLVVVSQTAQLRPDFEPSPDDPNAGLHRAIAQSAAYSSLKRVAAGVRSLESLRGSEGILLQPWSAIPLGAPEVLETAQSEVEAVDADAFYERYPAAAGLLTVSRAGIAGDEAVVFTGRMMVRSLDERLVRLRRVNGRWRIEGSVTIYEAPGC